jgi:hypothetical protein
MNLFLPAGYNLGSPILGVPESALPGPYNDDGDYLSTTTLSGFRWYQTGFKTPQWFRNTQKGLAPLSIPRTPSIEITGYFGITNFFLRTIWGAGTVMAADIEERIALANGVLRFSVLGDNGQILSYAEAPFSRNAFKVTFSLTDVGANYAGSANIAFQYEYVSESKLPFGPCEVATPSAIREITLVEPNVSLDAKTAFNGSYFGPEAVVSATASLTESEVIGLVGNIQQTSSTFGNVEIDEQLNLRCSVRTGSSASATLLGPVVLQATANATASASATTNATIGLVANAAPRASIRAIPYIGTTIFMRASATATATASQTQTLIVSTRVSGMTIYVDLESRAFVVSPVLLQPVQTMFFTRRDIEAVDVKFVKNGVVVPLSFGSDGTLAIKNSFTGAALAIDSGWGQKDSTYKFALNLNTEAVNDLFSDETLKSATANVELEWTEGGTINTTLPTTAIVYNDYIRGDEGEELVYTSTRRLMSPNGTQFNLSVDNNGILQTDLVA